MHLVSIVLYFTLASSSSSKIRNSYFEFEDDVQLNIIYRVYWL